MSQTSLSPAGLFFCLFVKVWVFIIVVLFVCLFGFFFVWLIFVLFWVFLGFFSVPSQFFNARCNKKIAKTILITNPLLYHNRVSSLNSGATWSYQKRKGRLLSLHLQLKEIIFLYLSGLEQISYWLHFLKQYILRS